MSDQPKPTTGSMGEGANKSQRLRAHIPERKPTTGEWTVEHSQMIAGATRGTTIDAVIEQLRLAHNAALAAERERLEKEWGREGIHITVERLKRELAAERGKREKSDEFREKLRTKYHRKSDELNEAIAQIQQLREQLAAAQAAIAEILSSRGCWTNGKPEIPEEISAQFDLTLDVARRISAMDTTALDAAITAARRPLCKRIEELIDAQQTLVDALEEISEGDKDAVTMMVIASDALAKVKEGNEDPKQQ